MAILCPGTNGAGLSRLGSFVNLSNDWTKCQWLRPSGGPNPLYTTIRYLAAGESYVEPWIVGYGFLDTGLNRMDIEASVPPLALSTYAEFPADLWAFVAWRYKSSTTELSVVINGSVVIVLVTDLSSVGAQPIEHLGFDDASFSGDARSIGVAYARDWQAWLSDAALVQEMAARRAVHQTNLLADTPLETLGTLVDLTGNGHNWTATAQLTQIDGPLSPMGCVNGSVGVPLTLADALDELAQRLDDTAFTHWTAAELTRYLIEALRTVSAFTQRWRRRADFPATINQPFYLLPSTIAGERGYNVTDQDLVVDIEYALMEPPTIPYTGTEQFNLALITHCLQSRLNQFLNETGAVLARSLTSVTPDANGRIVLPSNVIGIRRAAWVMANGTVVPLTLEDEWGMSHYSGTWPQNPMPPTETWPTGYSVGVTPPLTVQLAPAPTATGTLDLLAVVTAPVLDPTIGVVLGIPDDWSWVVKFGALAELLSRDGLGFDPARAAYCEARYQQGIQMAKAASVVLQGYINGSTALLKSLIETDQYRRTWQTVAGAPTSILTAAQNLVGLKPKPDGVTAYTITLDLIVNVLIPTQLTDCLQIDEQLRDPFFDLAQHLALFKEGPAQVDQAMALYERFSRACGITVALDQAAVPNRGPLLQQTVQDQRIKSRDDPAEPTLP